MKCLSLWQPWASLLAHGKKRVETRGWAIPHRGPLLIHAAKKWDRELADLCLVDPFASALTRLGCRPPVVSCPLPLGAIIGRVDVQHCYPTERVRVGEEYGWEADKGVAYPVITPAELSFGDYSPGRFAWVCKNPVAFPAPIPYRGFQGLFEVPDGLLP